MLIRLEVANYKSFRDRQAFTMIAGPGREAPGNLVRTPRFDLIKSAAIYGHNASGKTNLLDVLYALGRIIVSSARGHVPDRVAGVAPFRLDAARSKAPSEFEIEVLVGESHYQWKLEATAKRITYEALYHRGPRKHGRWARLLERPGQDGPVVVSPDFAPAAAQREALVTTTVPERSMVGAAAALNVKHARRLFGWFNSQLYFYKLHSSLQRQEQLLDELANELESDPQFKSFFLPLIADADFGVVDARVVKRDKKQLMLFEQVSAAFQEAMEKVDPDTTLNFNPPPSTALKLKHWNRADNFKADLPFHTESSGTRRFLALIYALLRHRGSRRPGTIVIDELDSSMSPDLVQRFLLLAHNSRFNPSGSQVLFSTHDRSLMDVPDLLRRDQVWIAEKREDGATRLYSLADFGSDIKPNVPKARQFSAGRYGGVADFGPLLEDVPREAGPQTLSLFSDDEK